MAHFWTVKAFLPEMIVAKKGHIVSTASLAGHGGTNKLVDYCASKFANVGFDEALRTELYVGGHADYIHTTCICPYYISTGMFEGVQSKASSISVLPQSNSRGLTHGAGTTHLPLSFGVVF